MYRPDKTKSKFPGGSSFNVKSSSPNLRTLSGQIYATRTGKVKIYENGKLKKTKPLYETMRQGNAYAYGTKGKGNQRS